VSALEDAAALLGPRAARNRPLGLLTTYRVGGPAALFLEAANEDDLDAARKAVTESGVAVMVLGKGSNLLVADAGFRGLVVTLGPEFASIGISGTTIRAGAAAGLPVLARQTAAAGLAGLEWAVGVPGSVGGGVRMNAGGHGSDMAGSVDRWAFVDLHGGPDGERGVSDLAYGYRRSSVAEGHVVVWASFPLRSGDRPRSEEAIAEIVRWRRANQPGGQNAGSVFTNPEGDSAGRIIEACGLKGLRLASAEVSDKHANFIQADAGGSADDVRRLIEVVRERVGADAGVELVPEVRMVGFG
jgi:UDP-N-acetylmuramate dehydrogenase